MLSSQYFLCTFIAVSAWSSPPYDWAQNYISDLGVRDCVHLAERFVCSPLHNTMNMSLIVQAGLFALSGVLGLGMVPRYRPLVGSLLGLTSIGVLLVGLFPGSIEGAIGTGFPFHRVGAFLGIGAGNVLLVVLGLAFRRRSRAAAGVLIGLGMLALFAMIWLANWPHVVVGPGLPERIAADTCILTGTVAGVFLLLRSGENVRATPQISSAGRVVR